MSKRLIRIFPSTLLLSLPKVRNEEMNVVQRNGHTVFGVLESFTDKFLIIKDLRSHLHEIALADVDEIILDYQGTPTLSPTWEHES